MKRINKNQNAFIIAEFPPQHIGEQAFFETAEYFPVSKSYTGGIFPEGSVPDSSAGTDSVELPVFSLLSGLSRLVFRIPKNIRSVPFSLKSLLDWADYDLSLVPRALPPPQVKTGRSIVKAHLVDFKADEITILTEKKESVKGKLKSKMQFFNNTKDKFEKISLKGTLLVPLSEPKEQYTVIEAPYGLLLSPNKFAGWAHSTSPVEHAERFELWHTRLGIKTANSKIVDEISDYNRTLRAIWTRDYAKFKNNNINSSILFPNVPFRMSLTQRDKWELVNLTSDFKDWQERVIRANRLMLSSLGVWLNVRYADDIPVSSDLTLEEWRHIATMGRDQYVRVVYKGYLLPFGNKASLIKVTERKFKKEGSKKVAALFQRMYIVVRQPTVLYKPENQMNGGRKNPFKSITITTLVTPDLEKPEDSDIKKSDTQSYGQSAFWPMIKKEDDSKSDFKFHIIGEDAEENKIEFTLPLLFVDNSVACISTSMSKARDGYDSDNELRRTANIAGQKLALVEEPVLSSDSSYETKTMTFVTEKSVDGSNVELNCFPAMKSAEVHIPGVREITGKQDSVKIRYNKNMYLDSGFGENNKNAEIFAEIIDGDNVSKLPLKFTADKSGGIVTPNMNVVGLSRKFGPIGGNDENDLETLGGYGMVKPEFSADDYFKDAKILGGINLADIINISDKFDKNLPKLTSRPIYDGDTNSDHPVGIETIFHWEPDIQSHEFFHADEGSLTVNAKIITKKEGSEFLIEGNLRHFTIDLLGFVIIDFEEFTFRNQTGKKLEVNPNITSVSFGGPLAFVKELTDYLSGNGLDVNVTTTGIYAGFTSEIPTISAGVLTIQNIAFNAGLNLPFSGDPIRLRFSFCKRENPFILTVYGLGGGGFFGLDLGIDGVELLEASLEFGASIALDIGVASGEVHIMAGIYYKWQETGALLEGFVRLGGELEVLAIVSLSVEFYMSLAHESGPGGGKVWGEASLTVKVEVLMFSESVTMKVRREFSDPDPITFEQYMSEKTWTEEYCEAFE